MSKFVRSYGVADANPQVMKSPFVTALASIPLTVNPDELNVELVPSGLSPGPKCTLAANSQFRVDCQSCKVASHDDE